MEPLNLQIVLTVRTGGSPLALAQANLVREHLLDKFYTANKDIARPTQDLQKDEQFLHVNILFISENIAKTNRRNNDGPCSRSCKTLNLETITNRWKPFIG